MDTGRDYAYNMRVSAQSLLDAERAGSNRGFGLTVGGILAALGGMRIGLSPIDAAAAPVDRLALCLWALGGTLIVLALFRPAWLAAPNRWWHRLGLLLARVVNPVVLLLLYTTCIVPIGLAMRALGHDPLRLRRNPASDTWWIAHKPTPLEHPMRHLF